MKKWLCFVTLVPLLLLGATLWARKAAWDRLEGELRQEILVDATKNSQSSFVVSAMIALGGIRNLATLTPVQLNSLLADVHLQKAVRSASGADSPVPESFRFAAFAGKPYAESGFYISAKASAGVVGAGAAQRFNDQWKDFELTPASAQILKRRVWEQYGAKLRALHISSPSD